MEKQLPKQWSSIGSTVLLNKIMQLLASDHSVVEHTQLDIWDVQCFSIALLLLLQLGNTWLQLMGADKGTHCSEYLLHV